MGKFLLYLVIVLCTVVSYGAQDSLPGPGPEVKFDTSSSLAPLNFDEEKIAQYKSDKAFNYLTEIGTDSWWTKFKRWLELKYAQLINWLFGDYEANSWLAFFLMLLPYLIIGTVIGLIIWLFIRLNPGPSLLGKTETAAVYFTEDEKLVQSADLSSLIEAAIAAGDYRLAIRYYYLKLLKLLHHKKLIHYEFQKTDTEYLAELKDDTLRSPLKRIMRIYDFIWYGNFPVSEKEFAMAQDYFRSIETSLNRAADEK
ncbi:DUF4129 domain-containing protein [Antarcticibacterium arcticum]|uniref:DUF4129 domain-containing protein n=1 Tax=Antarcticibacterium arcticum TaxID=2585771 RepID=A0A5B8YHI9_9FLAO|nr:DUF4129 domain-containing protein [Antarcticibacterium arcticum]QED37305.1 DUF4129 domain-containing protein [Antarcticibacterium arcticum]